ncbi:hypothetical protein [Demequina litorisediminis]|uniref:Uncharacterized protein n=1 Tax=Demequina litorisediminis TaxID=1849022 RepID=A0ABQ6ICD3_9MICO|nr:hypothetical protein GCM10025876_12290 [Demequina litorisediminis]
MLRLAGDADQQVASIAAPQVQDEGADEAPAAEAAAETTEA